MHHRPALDSSEFQAQHAHRLQQYQGMPGDEALRLAELTIGSDPCWRPTANRGVIHIDRVSYSMWTSYSEARAHFSILRFTDSRLRPFDVTALTVGPLSFNLPGYFSRAFLTIN